MSDLADKLLKLPPVRVMVVGDAMTDVDLHGGYERFAQEAPHVPIFSVYRTEERPGGAGAVAAMVAALGGDVSLLAGRTAVKTRRWVDGVMVGRDDADGYVGLKTTPSWEAVVDLVQWANIVLVADYGKGFCTDEILSEVIAAARGQNTPTPVIVDPARGRSFWDYCGATAIKCNQLEWRDGDWAVETISRFEAQVVTAGDRGMELRREENGLPIVTSHPARMRKVVDVTGCGDMVLAALGVCVGGGMSWEDACRVANSAAGLKVERHGAVPVPKEEVVEDLRDVDLRSNHLQEKELCQRQRT